MNIINVGSEELNEWDLKPVEKLNSSFFVYSYEYGSYDGSGFAAWDLPEGKYGYAYLGHCSCNGPTEDLNSIPYTLEELEQIGTKYSDEYAPAVIAKIKELAAEETE